MGLASIFVFLFGLAVGSFLNAVIYRLALAEGLVSHVRDRERKVPASPFRGRSFCPRCGHTLSWRDLIPVASFLLLGGKCRYCKARISMQYPLVELATAFIFLAIFSTKGGSASGGNFEFFTLVYLFTIASLLIVLFVYDLKHYILPDKILFPAIGLAAFWDLLAIRSLGEGWGFVVSGFSAAAFFLAIFLLSRGRAMGFGDVKLAFFMGLFLGWPNILVALFLAFCSGAAIGLVLIILKKKGLKSEIPFGPFLIGGTFGALFWGKEAVDWYLDLMLV